MGARKPLPKPVIDEAYRLYMLGNTCRDIANQLNLPASTIQQRARRDNWKADLAHQAQQVTSNVLQRRNKTLQVKADKFLTTMADDVLQSLQAYVSRSLPDEWAQIAIRERSLGELNKRARTTFGLDTEQSGANIIVVGDMTQTEKAVHPIEVPSKVDREAEPG